MALLSGTRMTLHTPPPLCATWVSPLGTMVLAATPVGLAGAWFADQANLPAWAATPTAPSPENPVPALAAAREQLDAYFQGRRRDFELPLDTRWSGTAFQRSVWDELQTIPHGQTTSYGQIAQRIGRPQAVRAVGGAVGRNPWAIVVPCHRVVGAQGQLTGYAGGLHRKVALLALEGR